MSRNLAYKNVKKSMKDYTIYFITLLFAVCLFYVFNSMDAQNKLLSLSHNHERAMDTLIRLTGAISVFIAFILGGLIVYANNFLIRRRKKELGIYMVLGMDNRKIARMLVTETLLIGAFALVAGLVAGIFISQGLSVVTASLLQVDYSHFQFVFSPASAGKTIFCFGIIFLFVTALNVITLNKYQLIDLLNASGKSEKIKIRNLRVSVVVFIISLICIAAAYKIALGPRFWDHITNVLAVIVIGAAGTFLFFFSLSGFLLQVVKKNKKFYFRGLNAFNVKQINAKITTTFIAMTFISLMTLIAITALAVGQAYVDETAQRNNQQFPVDMTIMIGRNYEFEEPNVEMTEEYDMEAALAKYDISVEELMSGWNRIDVYKESEPFAELGESPGDWPVFLAVSVSQWNLEMEMRGEKLVELEPGEVVLNASNEQDIRQAQQVLNKGITASVYGTEYQVRTEFLKYFAGNGGYVNSLSNCVLIVPDEAIKGVYIRASFYNYIYEGDKRAVEHVIDEKLELLNSAFLDDIRENIGNQFMYTLQTKIMNLESNIGTRVMVAYLTIYVGAIFLIASAAVLALQQLSESSDNIERYAMLRKIGVEEKEIRKSMFAQICIYFLVPLGVALVHAVVGIQVGNAFIMAFTEPDLLANMLYCGGMLLLIYGSYMIATYAGSLSMIRERNVL